MTTLTDTQVITASGGLVELGYSQITSNVTVSATGTGTSATSVIPAMTVVCDGGPISVEFFAPNIETGAGSATYVSLLRDGAEIIRYWGVAGTGAYSMPMRLQYRESPTAGSHTYEVRAFRSSANAILYAANSSSGHSPAFLRVSKIVQATQWPAVTTGTIICTSSTRPASPFAGQKIWETDTSKEYTYTGSSWIQTGPPPRRLDYKERNTSGQTIDQTVLSSATDFFASDISFAADGTTTYTVEVYIPFVEVASNASSEVIVYLTDGGNNSIYRLAVIGQERARTPLRARVPYTPSAGTRTLNVRAIKNSVNNGMMYAGSPDPPAFIAVYTPDLT